MSDLPRRAYEAYMLAFPPGMLGPWECLSDTAKLGWTKATATIVGDLLPDRETEYGPCPECEADGAASCTCDGGTVVPLRR